MTVEVLPEHQDNAPLSTVLTRYGHLPIHSLRLTKVGPLEIWFHTCADYAEACAAGSKKAPDRGRRLGGISDRPRRILEHVDRDGAVLTHMCWPHLDCWGSTDAN